MTESRDEKGKRLKRATNSESITNRGKRVLAYEIGRKGDNERILEAYAPSPPPPIMARGKGSKPPPEKK
jgi:hypothetical protein